MRRIVPARVFREATASLVDRNDIPRVWHLKSIVRSIADGKTKLRGMDPREEKYLDNLLAEPESLYETVNKSKEEIAQTVKNVVSKDGKTLTITMTGVNAEGQTINNKAVYDKQ